MTAELKPCPFCGKPPEIERTKRAFVIGCNNDDCPAQECHVGGRAEHEGFLVSAWNTRPHAEPAPAGEVVMANARYPQLTAAEVDSILRDANEANRLRGYRDAFYELGALLDIPAQAKSPGEVWRGQMLPRIKALTAPPAIGLTRDDRRDAERFRALMRCGRIKMQGSSGVDPKTLERNGNNVHFGAEFWPDPPKPEYAHLDGGERSTAWGRACLRHLADAILEREAREAAPQEPGQ